MARAPQLLQQRRLWGAVLGLVTLAFWVVGIGVGWRAWILEGPDTGIVAHTSAFGLAASPWWTVASVLTLTTAVISIGIAVVRHLVDDPDVDGQVPSIPPVPVVATKPTLTPLDDASDPRARRATEEPEPGGTDVDESDDSADLEPVSAEPESPER